MHMLVFALLFEHHAIPAVYTLLSMRGSRIFRQGGPGQSNKKSPDNVFFSPQLILLKSNG